MAHIVADRIRDTTTTTGTGAITVSGTPPATYKTFSHRCATSDTLPYFIAHQTADEWEVGIATYSASNQLTRTTVLSSSNSDAVVSFSSGTKDVVLTQTAEQMAVRSGTLTTSLPALDLAQTWNAAGVTFTGLKLNVTSTASAAGSLLADLQVGGATTFKVDKNATLTLTKSADSGHFLVCSNVAGGSAAFLTISQYGSIAGAGACAASFASFQSVAGTEFILQASGLQLPHDAQLSFASDTTYYNPPQTIVYRDGSIALAIGNSTTATALRVYNTTDQTATGSAPTNYERGVFDWITTANTLTIGSQAGGSGTLRKLVLVGAGILTNATVLPTSNPSVAGQLWNNGGVVTVS